MAWTRTAFRVLAGLKQATTRHECNDFSIEMLRIRRGTACGLGMHAWSYPAVGMSST